MALDQWPYGERPASPNMEWWTSITSNPLWYGQKSTSGDTVFTNPTSANSPLAGQGVSGTSSTGGAGVPLGGFGKLGNAANTFGIGDSNAWWNTTFAGTQPAYAASTPMSAWSSIGSFLGSPGGGAIAQTGLGMLSNYFGGKAQAEAQRAAVAQRDREQLIAQILGQFNNQQNLQQRQGEVGAQGATQVPLRQGWRERQALLADILPQLRNVNVQMPGSMQAFKPQISGGLRLPEGGLSQDTLAQFSPAARQSAEQDLDRQLMIASQGNYAAPNYASYYGSQYAPATDMMNRFGSTLRSQQQGDYTTQNLWLRDLLNKAIAVNG